MRTEKEVKMYEGCCPLESHASNRFEEGFEDKLRVGLRDYRINMKNFAFMRNMRNVKVLDPSPVLTHTDEDGEEIWGMDSVHPLLHGYRLLCDIYESEISLLTGKTRKRSGEAIQPPPKRARAEPRPAWIETPRQSAVHKDWKTDRGRGGGRGGRGGQPYLGRGGAGWRGGRGGRGG
jgi:hypothetical protein